MNEQKNNTGIIVTIIIIGVLLVATSTFAAYSYIKLNENINRDSYDLKQTKEDMIYDLKQSKEDMISDLKQTKKNIISDLKQEGEGKFLNFTASRSQVLTALADNCTVEYVDSSTTEGYKFTCDGLTAGKAYNAESADFAKNANKAGTAEQLLDLEKPSITYTADQFVLKK